MQRFSNYCVKCTIDSIRKRPCKNYFKLYSIAILKGIFKYYTPSIFPVINRLYDTIRNNRTSYSILYNTKQNKTKQNDMIQRNKMEANKNDTDNCTNNNVSSSSSSSNYNSATPTPEQQHRSPAKKRKVSPSPITNADSFLDSTQQDKSPLSSAATAPSITTLTSPSIGICQRPPMKIYFSWEPSNLHLRQTSVWIPKYVHYTKNGVDQWYRIIHSDRDGSCLFHSFHHCLLEFASIDYAIPGKLLQPGETIDRYLRRVIVEHMKNDLGPYVFWIEAMFNDQGSGNFESAEAYLEHMLDSNEYGGHNEIFVFSQLYNLGVRVLGQEGDAHCVNAESNDDSNDSTNMISVLYTGDNDRHYEAAIPIEAAPNATVLQKLQHTHVPNPDTPLGGEEDDDSTAGTINNNDDRDSWLLFSEEGSSYSDDDNDEDESEYEIDEDEDEDEDDILSEAEPKKRKKECQPQEVHFAATQKKR